MLQSLGYEYSLLSKQIYFFSFSKQVNVNNKLTKMFFKMDDKNLENLENIFSDKLSILTTNGQLTARLPTEYTRLCCTLIFFISIDLVQSYGSYA